MKFRLLFICTLFLAKVNAQQAQIDSVKGTQVSIDSCQLLASKASQNRIKNTPNNVSIFIANEIIIRADEIKKELVDSIYVLKCPKSYEQYGNLGMSGIIIIKTRQKFIAYTLNDIVFKYHFNHASDTFHFAINGNYSRDNNLLFSKKTTDNVDFEYFDNKSKNLDTINIWTESKKTIRKYKKCLNRVWVY